MKKFVRNCICIILVLVLISFLIPTFKSKAESTIDISGKVTVEGRGISDIGVEVLKEDETSTGKNVKTNSAGDYTFNGIEARKKLQTKIQLG